MSHVVNHDPERDEPGARGGGAGEDTPASSPAVQTSAASTASTAPRARGRRGREDLLVAVAICLLTWVALGFTAADIGLTYDEPIYMSKADQAAAWLGLLLTSPRQALRPDLLAELWAGKDEHPGVMKLTTAATSRVVMALHLLPAWAMPMTWLRTGTMFWMGLALAAMYLLLRAAGAGRGASLFAPGALLFMPRVFAHAHLASLDAPAMATCFLAVAAAWWAVEREDRLSLVVAGVAFGIALGTKLNGFFVPLVTLPYALLFRSRRAGGLAASYAVLGTVVFFATWPWLWFDTAAHLADYLAFHLRHWKIGVLYFGRVYTLAPWHYPLVMTATTVPAFTLVLALAGLAEAAAGLPRRRGMELAQWKPAERLALLAALGLVVNLVPNMLPGSPKYGGVRLFLPAMAWIAVLAALALDRVLRRLRAALPVGEGQKWIVSAATLAFVLAPSLGQVAHYHPYCLSAYNGLIGGLRGAVRHGFEATYWGDTYLAAALWLSGHAPARSTIWIDPQGMESVVRMYRFLGPLRRDLRTTSGPEGFAEADFAVSQNKPTEFSREVKRLLATREPIWSDGVDGVPLVFVWDLRR